MAERGACAVEGCDRPIHVLRLEVCQKHYFRLRKYGDPTVASYSRGDLEARLREVLRRAPGPSFRPDLGDCLVYTKALSRAGYGRMRIDGRMQLVHRFLYERTHGPVDTGLHLDHLCRNRACAEIKHLQVVTSRENAMRGLTLAAYYVSRDSCENGHKYTPENTKRGGPDGRWRVCRTCEREVNARSKARRRAAARGLVA